MSDKYDALRVTREYFFLSCLSCERVNDCRNFLLASHHRSFAFERAVDGMGLPWIPRRIYWIPTVTSFND